MARVADSFYFENFAEAAENNCRAARMLEQVMREYDPDGLETSIEQMHEIEQTNDELRHELLDTVLAAFITPIEREGIVALSGRLDDVTDCIEGVLHRLYYNNVREVTAGALEMVTLLVRACDEVRDTVSELPNFRKSKTLRDHIVAINTVEGLADDVFVRIMRELHTSEADALRVISMRETYMYLEYCVDACEHVGDEVMGIVMENS